MNQTSETVQAIASPHPETPNVDHASHKPSPATVAALIRRIGQHHPEAHLLCTACEVTWSGPPALCWSCGHPATAAYTRRGALRTLLRATCPRPARPQEDR
ncbi:hypothetical protein ACFYZH_31860 [Streptomyces abikoensis]|uniref:hypothetical protein n=1 Tax=Streptomyces abikoensis TaxID=97398 RepID=UPI0036BB1930